jgi:hypothetical protein
LLLNDAERRWKDGQHYSSSFSPAPIVSNVSNIDTMTINIDEYRNAALVEYQAVGNLIHSVNQPYFTEIWKKMNELCDQLHNKSGMPFAAVQGSSGMGKTQLAFSLGPMGRPYFY